MLAQAGYRVASADLRGHGESSMGRKSVTGADDAITHPDIAADLLVLIRHLGGPAAGTIFTLSPPMRWLRS